MYFPNTLISVHFRDTVHRFDPGFSLMFTNSLSALLCYMYRKATYSFKLLRAFEGWLDNKPVSYYTKWGFAPDKKSADIEKAATIIRSIKMGQLLNKKHSELIINVLNNNGMRWNAQTNLGAVMTALNRQDPTAYVQTLNVLRHWSQLNNAELHWALNELDPGYVHMERVYPAVQKENNNDARFDESDIYYYGLSEAL